MGCSSGSGDLVSVAGAVTLAGRPLATGTVSFRPDFGKGNQSLHQPTGRIAADGNYVLYTTGHPGAPPGWYKVIVFASGPTFDEKGQAHPGMPKSIIDVRYNDPENTPLAIEVKPDQPAGAYDLKLE